MTPGMGSAASDAGADWQAPFVRDLPPVIATLLRQAVASYSRTQHAEALLWSAHALDPHCLGVHFALYKFYFNKRRPADAERVARTAMSEAARQSGFDPDWTRATAATSDWGNTLGPQHFYLFSLKALAFICLRSGKAQESRAMLEKLEEIDPHDRVGASVIRDLARGVHA